MLCLRLASEKEISDWVDEEIIQLSTQHICEASNWFLKNCFNGKKNAAERERKNANRLCCPLYLVGHYWASMEYNMLACCICVGSTTAELVRSWMCFCLLLEIFAWLAWWICCFFYFPRAGLFNSAAQLTYRPVTAALSDRRTYPIRRYTRLIGCQGRALLLGRSRAATGSSLRGLIFRTASICIWIVKKYVISKNPLYLPYRRSSLRYCKYYDAPSLACQILLLVKRLLI